MTMGKRRTKKNRVPLRERLSASGIRCALLFLAAFVVLSIIFIISVTPKRYNLSLGEISPVTITASKDVEDELATEVLRNAAAAKVEPSYLFKEEVAGTVLANLSTLLGEVKQLQQYGAQLLEAYAPGDPQAQAAYSFTKEELATAKEMLSVSIFTDYQLGTLLHASAEDIETMSRNTTSAVRNIMNTTIRTGYVNDAIQSLTQVIGTKVSVDLLQNVVTPVLRQVVQPNMVVDEEATEKLREEACAAVEPVIYKQGQYIVQAREVVTKNQLAMLKSLGLLDSANIDIATYIGAIITIAAALGVLWASLMLFSPGIFQNPIHVLLCLLAICICVGACALLQLYSPWLFPTAFCSMLICCLLDSKTAVSTVPSVCILLNGLLMGNSAIASGSININIILTTLVNGVVAILLLKRKPFRMRIMVSGLADACCSFLLVLTAGTLTNTALTDVVNNGLLCAGGAGISALMCIALEPLAEAAFSLCTPSRLLEISNPNHPLLRRLMIEAPGTYHHSMIVANLAEAAAEAIGANPILARAGAYFHDIGKLKRPSWFKENQMGENPHDRTDPRVSAAIVIAHARDGLLLAQQNRLPVEIQDIIMQHHGDTLTLYFYHEALEQAKGKPVDIEDFRYGCDLPSTRESAIIMMADTVEAAVRSMSGLTLDKIRETMNKLIMQKLSDGQFEKAPITMQDISRCIEAFAAVLKGVFHERIEYPDIDPLQPGEAEAPSAAEESPVNENELLEKPEETDHVH